MVTATAETFLRSSPDETWAALGRRSTYLRLPGVTRDPEVTGSLRHALDLPIVDRVAQRATLSVARPGRNGHRERRFSLRGSLISVRGCWRLEPCPGGVRVRVDLTYDIAPPLKEQAVTILRSRSPLPIRTDADAILSLAVDEFFQTHLAAQAVAYCDAIQTHLTARSA